jgi:Flp pilus assembly pilin Flp
MLNMIMAYVQAVREREEGQALVEYALILALVSVASVVALTALGTSVAGILTSITGSL